VVHPPEGSPAATTSAGRRRRRRSARAAHDAGAAKWYRADGRPSAQRLEFTVAQGALLEWLPQSSILFDGIDARSDVQVRLAHDSVYIAFDVVCLGRTASNERFHAALAATRRRRAQRCTGWSERACCAAMMRSFDRNRG
jgi:urease accessory protein